MSGLKRGVIVFLATGAFSGYAPFMPGTVGASLGIGLYLSLSPFSDPVVIIATIALVVLSVWIAGSAEHFFNKKDPPFSTKKLTGF